MRKRILVVASDEATIDGLGAALENIGLEPVALRDRAGIVARFEQLHPAAVVMSVGRGPVDPFDVIAAIRATERGAVVPLLLMGSADPGEVISSPSEALEAGADYYFRLPTDLDYLAGRVAGWVGETHSTRPRPAQSQGVVGSPRYVEAREGLSQDLDLEAFHLGDFDQEAVTEHGLPTLDLLREVEARRIADSQNHDAAIPSEAMGDDVHEDEEPTKGIFDLPDELPMAEPRAPSRQVELALQLVREGERHRREGNKSDAIDAYWAASEIYILDEREAEAIALYKLILYLDPTRYVVARHGAEIALAAGRRKDALDMYRHTARALEESGRLDEATQVLREMVHLSPSEPTLVLRLAAIESRSRKTAAPRGPSLGTWGVELDAQLEAHLEGSLPSLDVVSAELAASFDALGTAALDEEVTGEAHSTREVSPDEIEPSVEGERRMSLADADALIAPDTLEISMVNRGELDPSLSALDTVPSQRPPRRPSDTRPQAPAIIRAPAKSEPDEGRRALLEAARQIDWERATRARAIEEAGTVEIRRDPAERSPTQTDPIPPRLPPARAATMPEGEPRAPRDAESPWRLHERPAAAPAPTPSPPDHPPGTAPHASSGLASGPEQPRGEPPPPDDPRSETALPRAATPRNRSSRPAPAPREDGARLGAPIARDPTTSKSRRPAPGSSDGTGDLVVDSAAPRRPPTSSGGGTGDLPLDAPKTRRPAPAAPEGTGDLVVEAKPGRPVVLAGESLDLTPETTGAKRRPAPITGEISQDLPYETGDLERKHRRPRPEPSRITFAPLVPNHGKIERLFDALIVFSLASTQRVTGMLKMQGDEGLVFFEGHPAARRGTTSHHRLAHILDRAGVALDALVDDAQPLRAVEAMRAVTDAGLVEDDVAQAILHRHLEDGVLAALAYRGPWRFLQNNDVDITTTEIVKNRDDVIAQLVELLPQMAPPLELASHLGGTRARVRLEDVPDCGLAARDVRFCSWLDGTKPLDVAATLGGLTMERAAAIALVLVAFGHGTSSGQPAASEPPAPAPSPEPPEQTPPQGRVPHAALAALEPRERLRALAELVRTSDYFTILGVDASATKLQIDEAHHHLRRMIEVEAFEQEPALRAMAREVARSLDEARDVLKVPQLRAAYQRHLKP